MKVAGNQYLDVREKFVIKPTDKDDYSLEGILSGSVTWVFNSLKFENNSLIKIFGEFYSQVCKTKNQLYLRSSTLSIPSDNSFISVKDFYF